MQVLSKGDLAREIRVTPGRVSQYIAEGKIGPDALEGEGRSAKIIVDRALAQLRLRRDVGQSLGNGIGTRLFDDGEPTSAPPPIVASIRQDDVAAQIQKERLESERRKNRQAAERGLLSS